MSFRDGYTQTLLVGLICFAGPGMFNGLTGLGAAGSDDPHVANLSNALLYIAFGIFGFFGGAMFNIFGNRVLFFVGGVSYVLYTVTQFLACYHPPLTPLAIAAGFLLGIGAAGLWTAQGASVAAYAPVGDEAKYISSFWMIFSLGGFFGGLLMAIGNWNLAQTDAPTRANSVSFLVLIGIMLLGPLISVTLLHPTEAVIKSDGEPVLLPKARTVGQELMAVLMGFFDTNMHLMALYFFMSIVWYAYFFNGLNDSLFNIRSRGVNSALFWLVEMGGTKIAQLLLDSERYSKQTQGTIFFWFLAIFANCVFVLGMYVQWCFEGGWDKTQRLASKIDFLDFGRSLLPMAALGLFGLMDSLVQTYGMWLNSALAQGDTDKMARYFGFLKSIQSAGSATSWIIDAQGFSYRFQLVMCWILFVAALPTTLLAVMRLPAYRSEYDDEVNELMLDEDSGYVERPPPVGGVAIKAQ